MKQVGERGSLLVVALGLVAILSALAVAIARYLSVEVRLTTYRLALAQAEALARSGIYLAIERLQEDVGRDGEGYDWLQDDWAYFPEDHPEDPTIWVVKLPDKEVGASAVDRTIEIQIVDEERRLPLNQVRDDPANRWFTALSELLGSPGQARWIAEAVVANGGAVVAHEELLTIPDMTEAFSTLREYTSIARGIRKLNINTVDPKVLVALGMASMTAQALDACREGGVIFETEAAILTTAEACAGATGLGETERSLLASAFGVTSQVFTVVSQGALERPLVNVRVEALIQRSANGDETPRILAWRQS